MKEKRVAIDLGKGPDGRPMRAVATIRKGTRQEHGTVSFAQEEQQTDSMGDACWVASAVPSVLMSLIGEVNGITQLEGRMKDMTMALKGLMEVLDAAKAL